MPSDEQLISIARSLRGRGLTDVDLGRRAWEAVERNMAMGSIAASVAEAALDVPTWVQAKVADLLERAQAGTSRAGFDVASTRALMEAVGVATSRQCAQVAREKAGPAVGIAVMLVGGRATWG